jgi:uncharacterized protein (DUF2336 family)
MTLSADEVRLLLEDKTPATRLGMTEKIAGAYSRQQMNHKEIMAAEQVFRLLLRDTELRVRISLAQHVKDSNKIPRDIILTLAKDVAEVSLPVLQYSDVLDDDDLLELIGNTQEISRYLAISRRKYVSEVVSGSLIDNGNDEVAATLVENKGAHISEKGFGRIIEAYRDNHSLMHAVGNHPRLPVGAAEKLINAVSASLAETLKNRYKLPDAHIQEEVEKTRESETLGLVRLSHSQEEVDRLINQLRAFDRLTPSIILSGLCQGNFAFFETSLAVLSNIPVSNARTLISDRGELGFRAIYNKSGLPDPMFPAVKLLLRVVRELDAAGETPSSARYANRVIERILRYSEETPVENLSYIIALVRKVG